jgi:anti-anti-sigma factor
VADGHDPGVSIERSTAGAMAIVTARGEFDLSAVAPLRAAVTAALAESPLIFALDLRGVTFIDCGTVGELIAISGRCAEEGCRMLVVRGGAQVDRVLSACGVEGRFDIVDGLDQIPSGEATDYLGHEPA